MEQLLLAYRNIFNYSSLTSRSEYWRSHLAAALISLLLLMIHGLTQFSVVISIWTFFKATYFMVAISLGFRRLQDAGVTGWLTLAQLIPGIRILVILLIGLLPSKRNHAY